MKIGIIREGKTPPDARVALSPQACLQVIEQYSSVEIFIQSSPNRCYTDQEYVKAGLTVADEVSHCDVLLGIKEVPIAELIPEKTYLFFSHTIKMQAYNRDLLNALLERNIRMVDYETLVDKEGKRVIAFGRYAGLVGAYNGLRAWGHRNKKFQAKPANQCFDLAEMKQECQKLSLDPIKIVVTGSGRVAKGAIEVLKEAGVAQVSIEDFLARKFNKPVFTQLRSKDYHYHLEGKPFKSADFFLNPEQYGSTFLRFAEEADMLIAAAYWHPSAPVLFTREDMLKPYFKIEVIADITCDIEGSIPSTKKPSTIAEPFYDYNPVADQCSTPFSSADHVSVMAVDNLPNELPRDASDSFGRQLIDQVLPYLLGEDSEDMIVNATIAENGGLTRRYAYLQDFALGTQEA